MTKKQEPAATKPTLLVLAAGIGSRYGGLKQIDPVGPGGETIIDYSIYDALRAGFGKLVFVIRRDIEDAFKETIGRRFEKHVAVDYVFQEVASLPPGFAASPNRQRPWGTGHAILMAAETICEPFAVINGDDFYGAESFRTLSRHLSSAPITNAMVGFVLRNTLSEFGAVARGVCQTAADGFLAGVTELTGIEKSGAGARYPDASGNLQPLTGDEIVSMNMWGFHHGIFQHLQQQMIEFLIQHGREEKKEFFIPTVVNTLIENGRERFKVLRTADAWFGVTYREDRPRVVESVQHLITRGDYPVKLWPT